MNNINDPKFPKTEDPQGLFLFTYVLLNTVHKYLILEANVSKMLALSSSEMWCVPFKTSN